MSVSIEDIRNIRPGATEAFNCESGKMYYVATALSTLKRKGLPDGVVDYEHKKLFDKNIVIVRAMRDGDVPVLNR